MTTQIAIVLALLIVALVLFSLERIPIEVVAILLVMALVLTNTLTASEAFAGFGNDIVITIAGLFILTGGLAKTSVIDFVGRRTGEVITWRHGTAVAAATVQAPLTELLLLIYRRRPVGAPEIEVTGNRELLQFWLSHVAFG